MNRAFVLGAGLGTRLRSLTQRLPKPLIPVANRPLIAYAFDHLHDAGIRSFVVNTHWLADRYPTAFPDGSHRGCPIAFRHEHPEVLETAGGLKHAEDLLHGEPFIVYNGDILTDLPLAPAIAHHQQTGNEVTLVLRSKDGPLQIAFDQTSGRIRDIGSRIHPATQGAFLFTGIYLVEPRFLQRIPAGQKISVIPFFIEMIRSGAALGGIVLDEGSWWDLGTRDQYLAVHQHRAATSTTAGPWIDPTAQIHPSARISTASAVGAHAVIGANVLLQDSLVWPGSRIASDSILHRCIVTGTAPVEGTHKDADL